MAINLTVQATVVDIRSDTPKSYDTFLVDYDLFILETLKKEGITNIITDDGDFATVSGITVFTANRNLINTAQLQGKLVVR
jgi:hypothetical protein